MILIEHNQTFVDNHLVSYSHCLLFIWYLVGLVWQLMRAYTLSMLSKLSQGLNVNDSMIVEWVNKKVCTCCFLRDFFSQTFLFDVRCFRELRY